MIVTIYGLGLIGGSLAKAINEKTDIDVYGLNRTRETLDKAIKEGVVKGEATRDILLKTDILIIAMFYKPTITEMEKMCPYLKPGCIVMDICGNKRTILKKMDELSKNYPQLEFVGTHPMAGKEEWGLDSSTKDLFNNASIVIVPQTKNKQAIETVESLYKSIGAKKCIITTPEKHDEMISYTSQLCHVISAAYVLNPLSKEHDGFSAGSFKDMTRVAKLSTDMWVELFLNNKENLSNQIQDLIKHLTDIKESIDNEDSKRLTKILNDSNEYKKNTIKGEK